MPMVDAEKAMDKFMEDLQSGKFKRERVPNPPPYFEGTTEEVKKDVESFSEFLDSDLFEHLKSI